jgi:hypothetical protein
MKKAYLIVILALFNSLFVSSSSASEDAGQNLLSTQARLSVQQVLAVLDENYVYPHMAEKMRRFVMQQLDLGVYDHPRSQKALIERLQADLREVSQDGHISLHLAAPSLDRSSHIRPATKSNLEVYSSNVLNIGSSEIGYLRFNKFSGDPQTKKQISDAMQTLDSSDALIIDLRENVGGDPNLVAFLSSYFVGPDTLLWSVLDRNATSIFDVSSSNATQRYSGEVCILTSKKTYSAAEAFTYTLKHLGRACVIGEATGGGAHLVNMKRVNDDIDIRIPVFRAYSPITKSNWEGTGVIPTILIESAQAKTVAIEHLKNRIN